MNAIGNFLTWLWHRLHEKTSLTAIGGILTAWGAYFAGQITAWQALAATGVGAGLIFNRESQAKTLAEVRTLKTNGNG